MVMPYLNFDGQCEAAFRLYAEAFGGEIQHMARYGDIPGGELPEDVRSKVMHAQLRLTDTGCISGADTLTPYEKGSSVNIHVHLPSEEQAKKALSTLAGGGAVISEIVPNPPPDDAGVSGAVKDRYGFTWILSAMAGE